MSANRLQTKARRDKIQQDGAGFHKHRKAGDAGQPVEGLAYLESWTVAAVDAALAAQNAVIAAESLGLGTLYIGALRNKPEEVAAVAGLPSHAAVAFGRHRLREALTALGLGLK